MRTMPERPEDFEDAWAQIVAGLSADEGLGAQREPSSAEPGEGPPDDAPASGPTVDPGLAALFEPLRRPPAEPRAPARDPGAFVDNWDDEGHFVPPPPPDLPEGTPVKRLAWAGLLGGPTILALVALTGWDPPRIVAIAAGLATLAGFVTLVWQMPESREDAGWDDGARL
jgi:hypothetical protein